MDWVSRDVRVPDDRRVVFVWGNAHFLGRININNKARYLGTSRFNQTKEGGKFDLERTTRFTHVHVTHWCEITGPQETKET